MFDTIDGITDRTGGTKTAFSGLYSNFHQQKKMSEKNLGQDGINYFFLRLFLGIFFEKLKKLTVRRQMATENSTQAKIMQTFNCKININKCILIFHRFKQSRI